MGADRRASAALLGRRLVIVASAFCGLSAVVGGGALMQSARGADWLPIELLEHTAFETFLVPGLVLSLAVGLPNLVCSLFAWRRSPASIDASLVAGGAMSLWILTEIAQIRTLDGLQLVYGALGLLVFGLGVWSAARSKIPRHRWILVVSLAEAFGFLVPVSAGIITSKLELAPLREWLLMVGAGFVEGLCLGLGQGRLMPAPVRRLRYALLTGAGAALVWGTVMAIMTFVSELDAPFRLGFLPLFTLAAVFGLGAIGSAQWLELRHHLRGAHRWISWTGFAWFVALPLSFLPSPLVDMDTPLFSQLALFGAAGLLMAYVMALVTWQGRRRLAHPGEAA